MRCDDSTTSRLIKLGGGTTSTTQAARFRAKESEPEFTPCSADVVAYFLDGLILEHRGPQDTAPPSPWPDPAKKNQADNSIASKHLSKEKTLTMADELGRIDNNVVLKQLRIALSLRSDDVHAILQSGGSAMSSSEAGALFRRPDARNYRQCGDQVLRQFIAGLVNRREQKTDAQDSKDT